MARRLGAKRDHLTVLVCLSYLAPNLIRAILHGRHPVGWKPKGHRLDHTDGFPSVSLGFEAFAL